MVKALFLIESHQRLKLGTASDAGLAKHSAKKRVEGMLVEITAIQFSGIGAKKIRF